MPDSEFDPVRGLEILSELVRLTAPPATETEICEQGLALMAGGLGCTGAALLLQESPETLSVPRALWGTLAVADPAELATPADPPADARRLRLALPPAGPDGLSGVVVLENARGWSDAARAFAQGAARTISSSLHAARTIEESRHQSELLALRNVELEALRALADRLQGAEGERKLLQMALDLVLEKMGLESGWIFWGEASGRKLELAASRGVAREFVRRSKSSGIGQCLCQDVFATGRLMFARNTLDCPRLPELVRADEPMTHACIPLKFERGVLGVMNIANRPGRLFTRQELRFLETVGHQVCLAVDKARAARAEARRNAEARALVALARATGGSLERERVLAAVGDYARELLSADRCAIFLGSEPGALLFSYLTGPQMKGLEVGRPVDFTALGSRAFVETMRERKLLAVEDAGNDPRSNAKLARQWGIGAGITVPLVAHDRLEGVLMASRAKPSAWSEEETDLADAFGRQAAVAIENARLYREAQEALLRLQEAQYGMMRAERMAAVGTLAASLAHEVRNPLNSINLQLVLMSRRLGRLDPDRREELDEVLETARQEITRLDGLVDEFLSLSSIDRVALVPGSVLPVLRDALGLLAPVARERSVSVEEKIARDLPAVMLDREKLKQVLINLIRNGIEAMPDGGDLTVSAGANGALVEIGVADTGVGIEPGLDVFDFFMTTKHGGTGLGLPIARRIVEAHKGTLTYESRPGGGTVFTVALRVAQA